MLPIIPIVIAAAGVLYIRTLRKPVYGLSGTTSYREQLPSEVANLTPLETRPREKNGRMYDVTPWPLLSDGRQFAVAKVATGDSWLAYWHNTKTGKRKFYRAYTSGNEEQGQRTLSIMMGDWEVT